MPSEIAVSSNSPRVMRCMNAAPGFELCRTRRPTGPPSAAVPRGLCLFQFAFKMVFDHVKQVGAVRGSRDTVRFAGIHHEAELLARLDQRLHHLYAVLEVYVIVAGALHQQ